MNNFAGVKKARIIRNGKLSESMKGLKCSKKDSDKKVIIIKERICQEG